MSSTLRASHYRYPYRWSRHSAPVMVIIAMIIKCNWNAAGHATLVVFKQADASRPSRERERCEDDRKRFSSSLDSRPKRERLFAGASAREHMSILNDRRKRDDRRGGRLTSIGSLTRGGGGGGICENNLWNFNTCRNSARTNRISASDTLIGCQIL